MINFLRRFVHAFREASKDDRRFLLDRMPKQAACAEIGVWKGEFTDQIVEHTCPKKLYLVDPWEYQPDFPNRMYGGKIAKEQAAMDTIFEDVRKRFESKDEVELLRAPSSEALNQMEDCSLDWVYVDGNHFYEYVKSDLEKCFDKVRPGGFITGDDYDWGEEHEYPIRRAVGELIEAKPVEVETIKDGQYILRKLEKTRAEYPNDSDARDDLA
jgi:hypothetical protein